MVLLFLSKTALFPSQKTKKVVEHITLSCAVNTPACKNRDKYALNPMYYKPTLKGLGSGLKAVMLADQAIKCGDADIIAAGGMESMSNIPYYLDSARKGYRMGNGALVDGMVHDGLWDVVNDFHMGYTAELISDKFSITREEMDLFSVKPNDNALSAHEEGRFKDEIMPVTVTPKRGEPFIVDRDKGPRKTSMEQLKRLWEFSGQKLLQRIE
ncbi:MAG: hypothetical protein J7L16_10580 [Deltaproteobacteria bacterium]|nr:hypothetical protein [Deltaproteobacteria bacterium]